MGADVVDPRIALLREIGADAEEHSELTLMDHLVGRQDLLREWGEREIVCDAGLFHSIYGTDAFEPITLPFSERARILALIGDKAESLVYHFCTMKRKTFMENLYGSGERSYVSRLDESRVSVSESVFVDLCHVILANLLEQRLRLPEKYHFHQRELFQAMRDILRPEALRALDKAYGF